LSSPSSDSLPCPPSASLYFAAVHSPPTARHSVQRSDNDDATAAADGKVFNPCDLDFFAKKKKKKNK
jgi:hypothetical protein